MSLRLVNPLALTSAIPPLSSISVLMAAEMFSVLALAAHYFEKDSIKKFHEGYSAGFDKALKDAKFTKPGDIDV